MKKGIACICLCMAHTETGTDDAAADETEADGITEDAATSNENSTDTADESEADDSAASDEDGMGEKDYDYEESEEGYEMSEWDEIMGIGELGLYYEAHMDDMDGECFTYSVYLADGDVDAKLAEIEQAVTSYIDSNSTDDRYLGYMDVSKMDDKVYIYQDLGNVDTEDFNMAFQGVLQAMNNVPGISSVIINEEMQ